MLGRRLVLQFTWLTDDIVYYYHKFLEKLVEYLKDTVEHLILFTLFYILLCLTLYCCIEIWGCLKFNRPPKNAKRVLFVIAHPDDESMFFGPTILHFTQKQNCLVYILCLSTGRNYGMGMVRKQELYKACDVLGIHSENIFIHNHTHLPDAIDVRWPTEVISEIILNYVASLNITTLITFDRYGVSNHVNHCSIYYSVANLILDNKLPKACAVYVLDTTNLIRKYWLVLDIPLSYIFSRFRFMGGLKDRVTVLKAMNQHTSQLKWFRRLYMHFSRYMLMNTLQQMNLVDVELDLDIVD